MTSTARILTAILLAAATCHAQFDGGGDLRLREEAFDEIPIAADPPGITRGGENNYFRIRSRLWGQAKAEDFTVYGRLTQEFRYFLEPDENESWDWPDEVIVDQLFVDGKELLGGLVDFRVGRQDLVYGRGRLILEGTPKDGSRTIYFDAAKLVLHATEKSTIDLLGIYNQPEAHLEIGNEDRDLTGLTSSFNDLTESAAGIYAKINEAAAMPAEAYYIWKNESDWETLVGTSMQDRPGRDVHTVGFRLMPRVGKQIDFEFEGAVQDGEIDDGRDTEGYLGYGGVTWNMPMQVWKVKPYATASCYYLSGDDPETAGEDEGWNPLFARFPQFSELYVYAFDAEAAGRWSNILYPSVEVGARLSELHKVYATAGLLLADEENGPGTGDERGKLYTARYDFPIWKGLAGENDVVFGHLTAELLDPGDYYRVDDLAYFLRWEVSYRF